MSDSSPVSSILLILILILINAFLSAAEMAVVSVNKGKVDGLADEGNKKAIALKKLMEEPGQFLTAIQVGMTLSGFFASASAAVGISAHLGAIISSSGIPYGRELAIILITIVLAYLILVLGELFPKRIAMQNSESVALFVIWPILFISKLLSPFAKLLSNSTNMLIRLCGFDINNIEEQFSKEEIRSLIEAGQEHGVINETEKDMINGVFEFDDTLAKEVMTPRTDVFMIDINTSIDKIKVEIIDENFSRIPVYEDDLDNVIGILYIKDFFAEILRIGIEHLDIRKLLRPAYFVPETKNIDDLFKELQSTKNHMAVLIDEYGGFSGIVTIEDLIEEVMGNILDEYDESEPDIKKLDNNTYLIKGILPLDELNEYLNLSLQSQDMDTVGGFVISLMGSISNDDESRIIKYENLTFKIEKVKEKRIEKLRLCIDKDEA